MLETRYQNVVCSTPFAFRRVGGRISSSSSSSPLVFGRYAGEIWNRSHTRSGRRKNDRNVVIDDAGRLVRFCRATIGRDVAVDKRRRRSPSFHKPYPHRARRHRGEGLDSDFPGMRHSLNCSCRTLRLLARSRPCVLTAPSIGITGTATISMRRDTSGLFGVVTDGGVVALSVRRVRRCLR